jgi:hypothetical protein
MRYVFRFWFALALSLMLSLGCSEGGGEGGSGGMGGTGGMAGTGGMTGTCAMAGTGGTGGTVDDCTGELTECTVGSLAGVCWRGVCGVTDCTGVENWTNCVVESPIYTFLGNCVGGSCEGLEPCEDDDFCRGYNDCRTDTCLNTSLCEQGGPAQDGTPCAGGTCESGACILEGSVLPCSEQGVRNAAAAGGGPYTFDCNGPTRVVTKAEIVINNDVELDGQNNLVLDGNNEHGVLSAGTGATVVLRRFTITGGGGNNEGIGNAGDLTLIESTVRDNAAGGIGNGGEGVLTMISSTVFCNARDGIRQSGRLLTMRNSTVSQNGGVGIHEDGSGSLTIENSTVLDECAIAVAPPGVARLKNTLIAGACTSAVSGEAPPDSCDQLGVNAASLGHNLESPGNICGFDEAKGDLFDVTAGQLALGPLQDNGGPTMTHALGAGSVAIDVIPDADCVDAEGAPLTTDQRGEPRPETGGTMCDVGAFELQP